MVNIKNLFGPQLNSVWAKTPAGTAYDSIFSRGFGINGEIQDKSILFVGLNPSFRQGAKSGNTYFNIYTNPLDPYLKRFDEIAKSCGLQFSAIDLLQIRSTNQSNVEKIIKDPLCKKFIADQVDIVNKIVEAADPQLIVVCNAYASRLIKHNAINFGDAGTLRDIGRVYHEIDFNGKTRKIMFTSMLSSRSALDCGSFEILKRVIKCVLAGTKC